VVSQPEPATTARAAIRDVKVSGDPGAYTFVVEVASPDTGCEQYANWWEVITPEGELLYRRVLLHSHVDEQPFTRSGGPVVIGAEQEAIVRAHMHPSGYGTEAFRGSATKGFAPVDLSATFAADLATVEPLPDGCAF